jgi:6-phosphofructokinase 1
MQNDRFAIETLGPATRPTSLERAHEITFIDDCERMAFDPHLEAMGTAQAPEEGFEVAGPRAKIFFDPAATRAAIVTCGGLCPGINAVIRAVVMQLWHRYKCHDILGIRYGFGGLGAGGEAPVPLRPDDVNDIHAKGGTVLGSSRGTPPTAELVDSLVRLRINLLFAIGGDGTMRGVSAIWDEIKKRGLKIAVIGVPKTIDNDIPFVRRSFGFQTAVSIATESVLSAHVEAIGTPYGVGLVKLMGRHAGYIAANASLASGHTNFCLIPEVPFSLEGPGGLLELLEDRIATRRHAVIVVAEGAGQYYFKEQDRKKDASGNIKLGDIGPYLRDRILAHFAEKKRQLSVKYIDPSYLIRSAQANPTDQLHCARFAHNAVHAAMAGKTGMLVGYWHGEMTHIPTRALAGVRQSITPRGELWNNVIQTTGQPAVIGDISLVP